MNELSKLFNKTRQRLRASVVRAVVHSAIQIVEDSPKFAGQLRASTNIGLNSIDLSVAEVANYEKDALQGTRAAASRKFELDMASYRPGDTIYISNNLSYAAIQEFKFGHLMFSSAARQFPAVLDREVSAS